MHFPKEQRNIYFKNRSLISHDETNEQVLQVVIILIEKRLQIVIILIEKKINRKTSEDQNNNKQSNSESTYQNKLIPTISDTQIGKALHRFSEDEKNKMTVLFNTAYAVACNGKPFSEFLYICELKKLNCLDASGHYNNILACENFINTISETLKDRIRAVVMMTNCVSVLADGSTDAAV